jgi:hypothetical protein
VAGCAACAGYRDRTSMGRLVRLLHIEALKVASDIVIGGGGLFVLYLAVRRQRTQEFLICAYMCSDSSGGSGLAG